MQNLGSLIIKKESSIIKSLENRRKKCFEHFIVDTRSLQLFMVSATCNLCFYFSMYHHYHLRDVDLMSIYFFIVSNGYVHARTGKEVAHHMPQALSYWNIVK